MGAELIDQNNKALWWQFFYSTYVVTGVTSSPCTSDVLEIFLYKGLTFGFVYAFS